MPLHWRPRPLTPTLPPTLRPWLTDPRSLTARIVARSGRFHVAVLEQCRARPMSDERSLFSLRTGEYLRVREVILYADDQPVVYARSVVSERDLRLVWRVFRGIGSRPLGAALFADPRIRRQPLFSAALKRGDARYHRALIHAKTLARPAQLWARRSLFRLRGRDLLVTEVFLPAVLALSEPVKRNTRS